MGVTVLTDADTPNFAMDIAKWLNAPQPAIQQAANDIDETLQHLIDTYPFKNTAITSSRVYN